MSFDLGNIVGSVVKAVLPMALEAICPESAPAATHPDAGASQSSSHAAPLTDPLSNFVATNGLHSSALEASNMSQLAALAQAQMFN